VCPQRFNQEPPEYFATKLLTDLEMDSFPINVRKVANLCRIKIKEVKADSFEGCAIKTDERAGILLNNKYQYEKRKRFTIAHELGHIILPYHEGQKYACTSEDMVKYSVKDEEVEANQFAAELLMPSYAIEDDCSELDVNLNAIDLLTKKYEVSRSSAALRFVDFTYGVCAVIFVRDGLIKSFKRSEEFKNDKLFVAVGRKVSLLSPAGKYFIEKKLLPIAPVEVPANAWLSEKHKNFSFHLYEQSFEVEPGKTLLSFIWTAEDYGN
jgi:Zn-dependent peptidase ImmA (M78 family)